MAVSEESGDLPVRGNRLKVQLLVLLEVNEREVATNLTEAPLHRLPELRHPVVELELVRSKPRALVRGLPEMLRNGNIFLTGFGSSLTETPN